MRARIVPASDSSWSVRIELPPGIDGRRKQKRLTVKGSKRDAQQAVDRFLAGVVRGEYVDPGRTTLSQLLDRWLASRRPRVARSTYERYESLVEDHIRPVLGHLKLSAVTARAVDEALGRWKTMPRRDRKKGALSQRTVHHIYATLSTIMNVAVRWELVAKNPCHLVEPVPTGVKKVLGLHGPDVDVLFAGLEGTAVYEPALVGAFGGLRRGEILGLHWPDLDLDNGVVKIERALDEGKDGSLELKEPKTVNSRRSVVLPEFVLVALRRHRHEIEAHFGRERIPPIVFPDWKTGSYWSPDQLSSSFYYVIRSRKLPRISLHGLRHTCSNVMQEAGVPLIVTSRILGHSDIAITGNIYTDVPPPELFDAARRLDAIYGGRVTDEA